MSRRRSHAEVDYCMVAENERRKNLAYRPELDLNTKGSVVEKTMENPRCAADLLRHSLARQGSPSIW